MAEVELIMPKMGESIMEATILKWLKKEGDSVAADETILEIATDKVDSEVPSTHSGTLSKILFKEGDIVAVGKTLALIQTSAAAPKESRAAVVDTKPIAPTQTINPITQHNSAPVVSNLENANGNRFYSPLVLNIARNENISMPELEQIEGSGKDSRVTKNDILSYLEHRKNNKQTVEKGIEKIIVSPSPTPENALSEVIQNKATSATPVYYHGSNVEIEEMDRMRKRIAENMIASKHISAHVTSFVEADVTNMVLWREKIKKDFEKRENEKITFTPLFVEAVTKALKEFPRINASVEGSTIIIKRDLNIGMATALPNGNLIVPVIKNADQYNLVGLTKRVNDLAQRARNNKLKTEDIEAGTFTISNVGTFGNLMGTPIILQPQVAILATGVIKKKPVVVETPAGDSIAIRHMMFLSLSYDHRIVDGALGGSFLRKIADILEAFNPSRDF